MVSTTQPDASGRPQAAPACLSWIHDVVRRWRPMTERMLRQPDAPALRHWDDAGTRLVRDFLQE